MKKAIDANPTKAGVIVENFVRSQDTENGNCWKLQTVFVYRPELVSNLHKRGLISDEQMRYGSPNAEGIANNSKEVGDNIFYHGGARVNTMELRPSEGGMLGEGIYLTGIRNYAEVFASTTARGGGFLKKFLSAGLPNFLRGQVHETRVLVSNPLVFKGDDTNIFSAVSKYTEDNKAKTITEAARKNGHDAIIWKTADGEVGEMVVFSQGQLAPVGVPTGMYQGQNPFIEFARKTGRKSR